MAIEGLQIIGEAINDSIPSTHRLFEAGDIDGIINLAKSQAEAGATYIDVNVGVRPPEYMADIVRRIQQVVDKPLAIDTPDIAMARAALEAYDPGRAGGQKPIINSISPLRPQMFELASVQPVRVILLVSEYEQDGRRMACRTVDESVTALRTLVERARQVGLENDDLIVDPGIAPLASDTEGNLRRVIDTIDAVHKDPDFQGVHFSVGLTNLSVGLPAKRKDGIPVKSSLESAFITKAMPLGLDMIIGSVKRNYQLLPPDHPAMQCLEDCLRLSGFEAIMRLRDFYAG